MDLASYLNDHGITPTAFARALGLSPSTVTRWINGETEPDPETARKIVKETDGLVTMHDIFRGKQDAVNSEQGPPAFPTPPKERVA